MNTFNKIVASPFIAAGWIAGQVRNGYDSATKAAEPVVAKATKAAKAAKASAAKAGVAVKAKAAAAANATGRTAAKVKDTAVKAATQAKAQVVTAATTAYTKVASTVASVQASLQKTRTKFWAGLTGAWGASAAVFFSAFAGIEYIFAYVYFLFAIVGLVFGMAPALATAYATAGMIVFAIGVTADLLSLWLQSVNVSEFAMMPDPFFGGRRLLALN